MAKVTNKEEIFDVIEVQQGHLDLCILGDRPLIMNRLSQKTWHELVMPAGRKNAAQKATSLKHNPMAEFQASPYRLDNDSEPTLLAVMSTAFKKSMMTAALDLPGTKKSQVGRLSWIEGDMIPVYGIPQIFMAPVRSADINHTPDIRTRAILPRWACKIRVSYAQPLMNSDGIWRLLHAGGMFIGIGDGRGEKGTFTFGKFSLVDKTDERFLAVLAEGGREAQQAAMLAPEPYDSETSEILSWFTDELASRKKKGDSSAKSHEAAA